MILFIHVKKCKRDDNKLLIIYYCLLLLIALVSLHHVISSGAKKNITLRILALYIFFGLHDVILKQNKEKDHSFIEKKKNE